MKQVFLVTIDNSKHGSADAEKLETCIRYLQGGEVSVEEIDQSLRARLSFEIEWRGIETALRAQFHSDREKKELAP